MRLGIRLCLTHRHLQMACWLGIASIMFAGCTMTERNISYIGNRPLSDYLDHSMRIAHPTLDTPLEDVRSFPRSPRTIRKRLDAKQIWDLRLTEAVQLALANNKILRRNDRSTIQGNGRGPIVAGDQSVSVWDPAIQETGVLFGGRGVESALSAFDAQLTARYTMGRSETVQNNAFTSGGLPPGNTLTNNTGNFSAGVTKQTATGATFGVSHSVDYSQANFPNQLFPSVYTGNVRADLRQPLLAGAGVKYTRVAGPIGSNIQGLSGVNQGVVIARINNDISLADFESNVTDMVFDVEKLYWDLHFAYRRYSSAVASREAGEKTWQDVKVKFELGAEGGDGFLEAQARDAYFDRVATEDASLANIDTLEGSLRRICGLPLSDGRILRPIDEPISAEFTPDWNSDVAMALTRRVELRRQKWNIKSTELQMEAARSLTKPRLDWVSSYQLNGFGDRLMSDHRADGVTQEGYHNFYDSLLRGHQNGWNSGVEFSMPFGFRAANAQVRNLELRLAKSRQVLRAQEDDVIYELAQAYQDLTSNWETAQTYFNRKIAATEQAKFIEQQRLQGKKEATLRDQLEAQAHEAQAETSYYQSIIEYTKSVAHVNYRKGAYLEMNNIFLSEGSWDPEAYEDALVRAWERTYSLKQPFERRMSTQPEAFATDGDPGTSTYTPDYYDNGQTDYGSGAGEPFPGQPGMMNEPQQAPGIEVPNPIDDPLPGPRDAQAPDLGSEGPVADVPGTSRF